MRKMLLISPLAVLLSLALCYAAFSAPGKSSGPGDVIYTEPLMAVIFSHADHLKKGMVCSSCHPGLFEMKALAVQERDDFTMASLYQGKYCGACHTGNLAFASDSQCARCHIGVKGYNRLQEKK